MTPRCLDLTRLVSRAGLGAATGIDRVERAYLAELLSRPDPLWSLVRTASGYSLLDRDGTARLASHIDADDWGPQDLIARASRRLTLARRRAEATVRRRAAASCLRTGLRRMLARRLPFGITYLNTGHSNLTEDDLSAIRVLDGARIAVLIHDTIPLDLPQYQRAGTPAAFAAKLAAVGRHADLVICPSNRTARDLARHLAGGRVPPALTAHLGVGTARPDGSALPEGLELDRPYFVALGTIEPRKNHALLLDVWERLGEAGPPPPLYLVGRRGWNNAALFARLDAGVPGIHELGALCDGAMAALLEGAAGLLFPSHAEGFGLPPLEAAALGVPVVSAPLDSVRETLGDYAVYADTSCLYHWQSAVEKLAADKEVGRKAEPDARTIGARPTWRSHFDRVLARV